MANYLYTTTLFKDGSIVSGISVTNDIDRDDFVNNYKGSTLKINSIILAETTFKIEKDYSGFKNLIDGVTRTWADIKYIEGNNSYELNLLRSNPI